MSLSRRAMLSFLMGIVAAPAFAREKLRRRLAYVITEIDHESRTITVDRRIDLPCLFRDEVWVETNDSTLTFRRDQPLRLDRGIHWPNDGWTIAPAYRIRGPVESPAARWWKSRLNR